MKAGPSAIVHIISVFEAPPQPAVAVKKLVCLMFSANAAKHIQSVPILLVLRDGNTTSPPAHYIGVVKFTWRD